MDKKVIIAHPGRQHSFKVASELKNNNMLFKYITTVYDSDKSYIIKILKCFLRGDNLKRVKSRKNFDLSEDDVVQFCKLSGLIEIFLSRYDKKRVLYNRWHRYTSARFGKAVAKYAIKNHVDAVIMYDTNAEVGFKMLKEKAPDILRIMDVSAANRAYMRNIYEKDFVKCPEFSNKLKQERGCLWDNGVMKEIENEIRLTQRFLVPSNFVKKSLQYSGIKDEQIEICPYGSNFPILERKKQVIEKGPLEAVYVGNVTEMKGIYYLLEAARRMDNERVHLTVVGHYDNSDQKLLPYMDCISFTGRVTHDKVLEIMSNSDFFVFPSLGEGLSLSVLEAMACGLPCIVTTNSGANDAIIDEENGFVVDIQNVEALQEKMEWFDKNRIRIPEMSCKAKKAIDVFNWDNHERCLIKALNSWIKKPELNINRINGIDNAITYSNEELKKIQKLESDALNCIIGICEKLEIEYFLIGGTTLGAIRHGGFIPWDDDIDIGMTRENYIRFLEEAPQYLPNGYFLQTPYNEKNNPYYYSKLRIDGTSFIEYCNHKIKMHHGVYVDIFPFDEVPDDEKDNLKQFDNVQKLIRLYSLRQSPDVSIKPATVLQYLKSGIRKVVHYVAYLIPHDYLCQKLEEEITRYNGTGQSAMACLNFPKRKTEYIKISDLYPLRKWKFGDLYANIPNNYDIYLKTHYGDYMALPKPENRFGHKPYKVDLDRM